MTPERRAELTAKLAEAEAAYHSLQLGNRARVIKDQTGESVEYSSSTSGNLLAYIAYLRGLLGIGADGCPINTAPLRFVF